ncbi:MAG: hypothetical protein ACOC6I_03285 [Candidatus Bipolaricaulota bacterium]
MNRAIPAQRAGDSSSGFAKLSGLISLILVAGLLTIGVTAIGANNRGRSPNNSGLLEDTFVSILAEKVGVDQDQLESMMDEAMNRASSSDERPIADNYLEILAVDLNLEVEQLKTLMVTTKTEAIDKLVSDGELSEKLAASIKERATTFPFGYSYQGSKSGTGGREGTQTGNRPSPSHGRRDRFQPQDGKGNYGEGECEREGPHRRTGNRGKGRSGGQRNTN